MILRHHSLPLSRFILLGTLTASLTISAGAWGASENASSAPAEQTSAQPSADKAAPKTPAVEWKVADKLGKDKDGKGLPEREALIKEFGAKAQNSWESPLTREESEAILDDPRAALLYPEKTISIVAPSMLQRQRQGHVDLLKLFLKEERIEAGLKFTLENENLLASAEKRHGVDREVIVSILMWESKLGTITGDYFAFNSFVTQAFFIDEANAEALKQQGETGLVSDEKQKQRVEKIRARARKNLVVLVRVSKARGIDPLSVKGSWAGALGFPQFMPASLRWAEDGDGDGKIDLFSFPDSIASIGLYLKSHGYGPTQAEREKAVWGYNHEKGYVDGVLKFADALKERRLALEQKAQNKKADKAAPKKASGKTSSQKK